MKIPKKQQVFDPALYVRRDWGPGHLIDQMTIVRKVHHGKNVWGESGQLGKTRSHSLCFRCARLHPGKDNNCPIAQELYELCIQHCLTTPVYSCPNWKPKRS